MKIQIRWCTFETNSSSVHNVCILTDNEYENYKQDKLFVSVYGDIMFKEDLQKDIEEQKLRWTNRYYESEYIQREYPTLDEYLKSRVIEYMYQFKNDEWDIEHTSREINGQKIHALSIYTFDG